MHWEDKKVEGEQGGEREIKRREGAGGGGERGERGVRGDR